MTARRTARFSVALYLCELWLLWPQTVLADTILIHDHFNGTGALAAHQPETNLPGHAWSVTGSGATVWNHYAWAAGSDWAGILATIDSGVADGTVAVDWTPGGDSPYGSVVARAADAANYIVAYVWSGTLYLYRIASTGNVLLGSTAIDDPGLATHRLKMVLTGRSIQVWYDGVLRLSASDAFNISATKHGVRWLSHYDWQSIYSNFEVDGNFVPTAASVAVAPATTSVPLLHSITLTATAYDNARHVIPSMNFSWTTSNPTAVTVASASGNTATVTGVGAGSATITAIPLQGSSSTAAVTVDTGSVAVFDTFTEATVTALAAHAPEVNRASGTWSTNGSGVFLEGNRATAGGADWNPMTASIDSGIADGTVEVDWTPGGSDASAATVIARMTDASNYLQALYWSDTLWLYRIANDHSTLLGQAPVADAGTTTHHLAMKLAGSAIEVWWDGVQQIVASDAFNVTATRHGFRWYSWWDWQSTYDRFEVKALPAIASVVLSPSSASIPMNGGRMFTAQAFDAGGAPMSGVSFTWQSSNGAVLSVRTASATTGAAIAEGVGSATLTAVAFGGGAQGSASVSVSAPPPPPSSPPTCVGGVFPSGNTWPADGGIGQITVSAPSQCQWSIDWNAPWITPLQASGSGNAAVSYAIDRNDSGVNRSGVITVGGATFTIAQTDVFTGAASGGSGGSGGGSPEGCAYTLSPVYVLVGSGGAAIPLRVTGPAGCGGPLSAADAWIGLSQAQGIGTWTAMIRVTPNAGTGRRTGAIRIGHQAITVEQHASTGDGTFVQFNLPAGVDYSHATFEWRRDEASGTLKGETCYFLDGWRCHGYEPGPGPGPPNSGCTLNCVPEDPNQGGGGVAQLPLPEFCNEHAGPSLAVVDGNLLSLQLALSASANSNVRDVVDAAIGQWNSYTSTTNVKIGINQTSGAITMRRAIASLDRNMSDPCADFDPDRLAIRWTEEFETLMSSDALGARAILVLAHEIGHAVFSLKDRAPYDVPRSIMEQYPPLPVRGEGSCTEIVANFAPVPVQSFDASNARQCVLALRPR